MPARPSPPEPGLCAACRHARRLEVRAQLYTLCEYSRIDPAYPRYPRLPVLACRAYAATSG